MHRAARVAILYAVGGALWILFSGRVLQHLVQDPVTLGQLETFKGWAFVAATAVLLYLLLRRDGETAPGDVTTALAAPRFKLWVPLFVAGLLIVVGAAGVLGVLTERQTRAAAERVGDGAHHLRADRSRGGRLPMGVEPVVHRHAAMARQLDDRA